MPRSENRRQLLRRSTSAAQYIRRSVPTSVYQTLVVTARLRQCCAGGLTRLPVQPLTIGTQRCRRSIAGLRRSDHITDTLASFHWLKAPERLQYKLATIVYRSLNATTPSYLASDLRRLSDMSRRRLRSSLTHQLDVRQSLCATVGDRTFATAGARLWNSLPPDIIACDTVPRFRRELKHSCSDSHTHLLCFSLLWLAVCRGSCSFYRYML